MVADPETSDPEAQVGLCQYPGSQPGIRDSQRLRVQLHKETDVYCDSWAGWQDQVVLQGRRHRHPGTTRPKSTVHGANTGSSGGAQDRHVPCAFSRVFCRNTQPTDFERYVSPAAMFPMRNTDSGLPFTTKLLKLSMAAVKRWTRRLSSLKRTCFCWGPRRSRISSRMVSRMRFTPYKWLA